MQRNMSKESGLNLCGNCSTWSFKTSAALANIISAVSSHQAGIDNCVYGFGSNLGIFCIHLILFSQGMAYTGLAVI